MTKTFHHLSEVDLKLYHKIYNFYKTTYYIRLPPQSEFYSITLRYFTFCNYILHSIF